MKTLTVIALLLLSLCTEIGFAAAQEKEEQAVIFDVMLLIDASSSTAKLSRDSARVVIEAMGDAHRLGIVVFGVEPEVIYPIQRISTLEKKTQAGSAFNAAALDATQSNLESALIVALSNLKDKGRKKAKKVVVLISDGRLWSPDGSKEQIARIKNHVLPDYLTQKVVLHAVAIGDADLDLLQICANITGGKSLAGPTLATMTDALDTLMERLKPPEQIVVPKVVAPGTSAKSVGENKDGTAPQKPVLVGSSSLVLAVGAIVVVAVALIVVAIVLLFQVLGFVRPKKAEERAESSLKVRKEGGFAGLRDLSNSLHNLLVDAGELSEHLNLDLEDFGVEGWKKQKALREKYGDLARGVFLLIDHLKIGVDGSGSGDLRWLHDKLERILEDENIEEMNVDPGEDFDGRYHVHVGEETSSLPAGSVIEVKRTGYVQNDPKKEADPVVLRRAEVVVVRGKSQKSAEALDGGKK